MTHQNSVLCEECTNQPGIENRSIEREVLIWLPFRSEKCNLPTLEIDLANRHWAVPDKGDFRGMAQWTTAIGTRRRAREKCQPAAGTEVTAAGKSLCETDGSLPHQEMPLK